MLERTKTFHSEKYRLEKQEIKQQDNGRRLLRRSVVVPCILGRSTLNILLYLQITFEVAFVPLRP